jgi:hypothetical protein
VKVPENSVRLTANELAWVLLKNVDERISAMPKPEHNGGSHERYHAYAEAGLIGLLGLGYAVLDVAVATRAVRSTVEDLRQTMTER